MTFTVKYYEIEHPLASEVSVTVTKGEEIASLIFFKVRRAINTLVPEFSEYATQYEPTLVYWNVPLTEVYEFLLRYGSGKQNARNHHKTSGVVS